MTVSQAAEILHLEKLCGGDENRELVTVYTSDLLSDVMGNADDEAVLVTIQAHKNTIAVATLKDSPAVILCNNRPIADDMLVAAANENIAVYRTSENQFTVSGKLFCLLHPSA